MAKSKKNLSVTKSNLDPRWEKYSTGASLATEGTFSSHMPKLVQGVAYLQKNNQLKIDIRYKNDKEYDRVVNVVDSKKSRNLSVEYGNEGDVTLTYKNWNKDISSSKDLTLIFASGHRKLISLTVPGKKSILKNSVDSVTSILTSSPYENMLSVELSNPSSTNNNLVVGVYPKADPYNVFNYSGVFVYNLPFAYYINSDSLNEVFVKNGITSSNKNVDKGMSTRGVGHLYPAGSAQEIHFINLLIIGDSSVKNNSELRSKLNSNTFTYGFIYGENLYDIPDDAPEFYVCTSEGDSSYYRTTKKDCDGTTIADRYIDGRDPAKFLDGQCCPTTCDGFSVKLMNTSASDADLAESVGKIKAIVTGGQGDWTYKIENSTTGVSTTASSADLDYEFTSLAFANSNQTPYKVTVTDANSCQAIAYIHLSQNIGVEDGLLQGCTDSGGLDYNSTVDVNTGCLFCLDIGPRGETYKALSFGMSAATSKALGTDLILNQNSRVTHATATGSSSGKIYFRGSVFPAAVPIINADSDSAYRLRLYSLGTAEEANNKTKAQILALSATTTVTGDLENEFTSLAKGWWAVVADVQNVPSLASCVSVYRFEVKYGGCTDKLANNYDKDAIYDTGACTYTCDEKVITIIVKSADNKCVKTVRVNRKKKEENITWKIGSESKTGSGPHLAKAGDYVHVYVENTKTKCTNTGEIFIRDEGCTKSMIKKAYSNSILNTGGCTDPIAFNYNCDALYDDGSCLPVIPGCTDIEAPNYDPTANVDNNSCIDFIEGCLNQTALNYNPLATLHNSEMCDYSFVEIVLVETELACPGTPAVSIPIYDTTTDLAQVQLYIRGGVTVQTGSTIKAYKLPHNTISEQGVTLDTLTFPLEDSGITPDATWKVTGTDSPFFNEVGTNAIGWNATTGDMLTFDFPNTPMLFNTGNYTANSGSVGYGNYVFEFKAVISGKIFYARYVTINPPQCGDIYSTLLDGGGSKFPGCTDINASNYTGRNSYPRWMVPLLHFPAPINLYQPNGLETVGTDNPAGAALELCDYKIDKICLPPRIDSQIKYLEECIMNGSVNWYNKNITGGKDICDDMALWTMILIKYLISKKGLDCIFNCADSGTPTYNPEKCEDKWVTGGSKSWSYSTTNYMGDGTYYQGDIVKYDSVFPWQGDAIPNTIWELNNGLCGDECGSPYGFKSENWDLCKDDKIFSNKTNYLDNFFKFATKYCKSCSPCSFKTGNENTFQVPTGSFAYSTEIDGTLTIGGVDLEIDGEEIESEDEF